LELESGRPNKKEQLDLQKQLWPCFEQGISASTTSERTGHNIKTVCKYFNEWANRIQNEQDHDSILRIKFEKIQYLGVLDKQLISLYDLQKEMAKNTQVADGDTSQSYNFNFKERISVVKLVFEIMEKKIKILESISPKIEVLQN